MMHFFEYIALTRFDQAVIKTAIEDLHSRNFGTDLSAS